MLYFTSDTHFNHKNIVKKISKWSDKSQCRDFETVEGMNNIIIDGILTTLRNGGDKLFHLGDFGFGTEREVLDICTLMPCSKIALIIGNHDYRYLIKRKKDIDNLHSLPRSKFSQRFFSVNKEVEFTVSDREGYNAKLYFSHFPRPNIAKIKNCINLHGHTHHLAKTPIGERSIYVGVDAWDYKPVSLETLLPIITTINQGMRKKEG